MAVYPIRPRQEKTPHERCTLCERKYTKNRKPVSTIIGFATNNPVFTWECQDCADTGGYISKYPVIVVEDTVNWRGE